MAKHYSIGRKFNERANAWEFNWRPIATAPKDGTVLLFRNTHNGLTDVGKWDQGEWTTEHGNGDMTHWTEAET